MKIRQLLALTVLGATLAMPSWAQFAKPEDAIKYRQSTFVVMAQHFSRIGAMANGKVPFDAKAAQESADIVAVMYLGRIVEKASARDLYKNPKHPYTQGLLNSVPNINMDAKELYKMGGEPPSLLRPPSGCRFHPRCPKVQAECSQKSPELTEVEPGRWVRCPLWK